MSAWTCAVCTYTHATAQEIAFLQCAMCQNCRDTPLAQPAKATRCVTVKADAAPVPARPCKKPKLDMASVLMANTRAPLPAPVSTARPKGQSFLYSTTLTAGPEEPLVLGLSNLRVEIVHLGRAADSIIIIRNAGVGTTALQSAITIAGSKFPKPGAHIPGRPSQAKQGRQRGVVQFPRGKTPCTLLHRATRAVLGAAATHLCAKDTSACATAAGAELRSLASAQYLSQTGGLVYDQGQQLTKHLDDILACNSQPFDSRNVLWNLGNSTHWELQPEPADVTRAPPEQGKTRQFKSEQVTTQRVVLHHGDAMLINIERVAHAVTVSSTCTDQAAARLLPDRRMCLSVRPALTALSPNAADYCWSEASERWINPKPHRARR